VSADSRPLPVRIINPRVPWWIKIPSDALAVTALIFLAINPDNFLPMALGMLGLAAVILYGTALVTHVRESLS